MKNRFSLILAGVLVCAASTFAAANNFTDQADFADWFSDSAQNMLQHEIMTGYADGSFQGQNPVNRAELATILDRFSEKIIGKDLSNPFIDEPLICTLELHEGLLVQVYDQNGHSILDANVTAVEASPITLSENILVLDHQENGEYSGLFGNSGYFTFSVQKDGYALHKETVTIQENGCYVIPQYRTITLYEVQ